jgi:hypothetical protein
VQERQENDVKRQMIDLKEPKHKTCNYETFRENNRKFGSRARQQLFRLDTKSMI